MAELEDDKGDMLPVRLIGLQAFLGTFWWGMLWFIYIGTHNSDELSQIPFLWMWKNLNNNRMGWLCAAYFFNFFIFGIISGTELLGYMWMQEGDGTLLGNWLMPWGYWLSPFTMWIPPFLAMLQLTVVEGNGGIGSD